MNLQAASAISSAGFDFGSGQAAASMELPAGRALVRSPIPAADFAVPGPASSTAQRYGEPAFITHLIATAQGAPQTRNRRRAEPDVAISAYGAASRATQPDGHTISKSR